MSSRTSRTPADDNHDARPRLLPSSLLIPSLGLWLALIATAAVGMFVSHASTLSEIFLLRQDLPVLAATLVVLLALRLTPAPNVAFGAPRAGLVFAVCAAVIIVGAAGWPFVFSRRGLSMDEFWATFDSQIFRRGGLMGRVPDEWRHFGAALQPMWRAQVRGGGHWASTYLPVNAALRAGFATVHAEAFASPVLAATGCAATWLAARRIWPQERSAGWVALAMVTTSSQLLVTAMTPYAMSAHFALNMIWLLAYLRGRALGYLAASVVGFLACGLHQLAFHLLFVAPFLVELWLAGRRRAAVLITCAYAAIALFWMSYPALAMAAVGERPAAGGAGATSFVAHAIALMSGVDLLSLPWMAENALRFITWQNPLLVPLTIVGAGAAWRARGVLRPLLVGAGLTLAVVTILMPYQGHGWGYRYLHGLLGAFALVAAAGWRELKDPSAMRPAWRSGGLAVVFSSLVSVLVLLPWRVGQARALAIPYVAAEAGIGRDAADVVLVDPTGLWFGVDLVRNDPFLERRPKVMLLQALSLDQLRALCRHDRLSLFDAARGARAGLATFREEPSTPLVARRALLTQDPACRQALRPARYPARDAHA